MDSILNEITYSDGRMDMQRAEFIDTPAKLKLRANTFQGINRSLRARHGAPSTQSFRIPGAYMAMDVAGGTGENGGNSGFTVIESDLKDRQVAGSPTTKRLKINAGQKSLFVSKTAQSLMSQDVPEMATPVVENVVPTVEPQQPVASVETEQSPVQTPGAEVPQEVKTAPSVDDAIDAAREKVLNNPTPAPDATVANVTAEAEQMDSFTRLQQATSEYEKMNEEIKQADERLEAGRKDLQGLQDKYSEIGKSLENQELEIHEKMEAIGEHERETAKIQENIEALNRKIEDKLRYVETLKKKRAEEKAKKEEEARKLSSEKEEYQRKIDDRQMKVDELFEKSKTLEEKEREALKAREEAQKILEQKNTLYEAITLPEIEGMEDDYEEEATQVSEISDFQVNDEVENEMEESGPSMVRSLGKAA